MTNTKSVTKYKKTLGFTLFGKRFKIGTIIFSLFLIALAIVMVIPIYWAIVSSIRPFTVSLTLPPTWLPPAFKDWTFNGFVAMFSKDYQATSSFLGWTVNSLEVSVVVTFFMVLHCCLSGYAFAKLKFPGRSLMFGLLIMGLMIPYQVNIIPMFRIYTSLGVTNTLWSLTLASFTGAMGPGCSGVFGTFMLRQFFKTIPDELNEAALIDGAGPFRTFIKIMLPISRTTAVSLMILFFTYSWNDYYMCSVLVQSPSLKTLPVGIQSYKTQFNGENQNIIFTAVTYAVVPLIIVFIFCQRWIVESLTRVGIKG